jgi:hypothetical protein
MTTFPIQNKCNEEGEIAVRVTSDESDVSRRVEHGTFTSAVVHSPKFRRELIFKLVCMGIEFTSVNYGAGVYRIKIKEETNG